MFQEASGLKRTFKVANNATDHDQLLFYLSSLSGRTRIAFTDRKRKALTAKMARVAYSIVKNGTDYQPFFEQRSETRNTTRLDGLIDLLDATADALAATWDMQREGISAEELENPVTKFFSPK